MRRPRLRSTVRESQEPSGSFYSGPLQRMALAGGRKVGAQHATRQFYFLSARLLHPFIFLR